MEFGTATADGRCSYNKSHRLSKGTALLTIREHGRKYQCCIQCARVLLGQGAELLQLLSWGATRLDH